MSSYPKVPVERLQENDLIQIEEKTYRVIRVYKKLYNEETEIKCFADIENGVVTQNVPNDTLIDILSFATQ